MTTSPQTYLRTLLRKDVLRSFVPWLVISVALLWLLVALLLLAARWVDPPTTAVHIQRRLQAWVHHTPYRKRYKFIPLSQISPNLQHAVIAAEDARFYSTMASIGTRSKSLPTKIGKAVAPAEPLP